MSRPVVYLDFISQRNGAFRIEGYFGGDITLGKAKNAHFNVNNFKYSLSFVGRTQSQEGLEFHLPVPGSTFEAHIRPRKTKKFIISVSQDGKKIRIRANRHTRLSSLVFSYCQSGSSLLALYKGKLLVAPASKSRRVIYELLTILSIIINWRIPYSLSRIMQLKNAKQRAVRLAKSVVIIAEAIATVPSSISYRVSYLIAVQGKKKPLWIISDRGMSAGDNGEAMFRFIMSQKNCPADVYFAISKKSKDFDRMKAIGPTLNYGSFRYKLKFLLADKIISSQADVETTNPFSRQLDRVLGLFGFDFVFLQHGIIRHDLSNWLNKYNKNIRLFVTSAKKEYDSILTNPYYYTKNEVCLSGLPRYDYLEDKPNGKLILAPTYRQSLVRKSTDTKGERRYDPQFKASEYFHFYNNLMNDPRIVAVLKKTNMTGQLYLHPNFAAQAKDFEQNSQFNVMNFPYDYKSAFREGEFLISDYSSVVFDFAYLKKPVAYAHFDAESFFDNHSYSKSNFFSDESDGFGEVYYNYESLVNGVVAEIESGRKMSQKYMRRVDDFFYRVDKNNCKRVYHAILALSEQSS